LANNYVIAGFETLSSLIDNFIQGKKGNFVNNFTKDDIRNFFAKTCYGFLHSYGSDFNKSKWSNQIDKKAKLLNKCKETGFFEDSNIIVDSGGFQISVGLLDKEETEALIKSYYQFVERHHKVFNHAFILDVPPGPNCKVFSKYEDVYDLNYKSYKIASQLPKESRKKIFYIHHFRTPGIWDVFSSIINDNEIFSKFENYATGGIVANMASDQNIPLNIYVLPIIPVLRRAIEIGKKEFIFHILGGANFRDIFFYELIMRHIKEVFNIDMKITYDSSSIFKALMIGRTTYVFYDYIVSKVDLRSSLLHLRFRDSKSVNDVIKMQLNEMSEKFNFKLLNNELYNNETNTFYESSSIYLMLHMIYTYSNIQDYVREKANICYDYYLKNDELKFNSEVLELTRNLNNGKITKKQQVKTNSFINSLNLIRDLNEDYCKYVINKYLSQHEFQYLVKDKILTF